jgi:predicted RNase H-like HicB family nuclease
MTDIIHFRVSKGDEQYVAEAVEAGIVTQASTLDLLTESIREATELHFDGEQDVMPTILLELNLTELAHA